MNIKQSIGQTLVQRASLSREPWEMPGSPMVKQVHQTKKVTGSPSSENKPLTPHFCISPNYLRRGRQQDHYIQDRGQPGLLSSPIFIMAEKPEPAAAGKGLA